MDGRAIVLCGSGQVLLVDSITQVTDVDVGGIIITGSHGGVSAADFASVVRAKLYVFNDAGIGKDEAGIAALNILQSKNIAACTVDYKSARIGEAHESYEFGVVSAANNLASDLGLLIGKALKSQLAPIAGKS